MILNYGAKLEGIPKKLQLKLREMKIELSKDMYFNFIKLLRIFMKKELILVHSLDIFEEIIVNNKIKDVFIKINYNGFVKNKKEANFIMKQGYRKMEKKIIKFDKKRIVDGKKVRYKKSYKFTFTDYTKLDEKAQGRAFKANLIHTLDAMIIYGTLKKIRNLQKFYGILTIHDCIGVCFDDIEIVNKIIREVIINLFSNRIQNINNIIYNICKNNVIKKKDKLMIKKIIKELEQNENNNFNIKEIQESFYLLFM
jgi:hypothetical protein